MAPHLNKLRDMLNAHLKQLAAECPAIIWRILEIAFSPKTVVKKLVLVSLLQLAAWVLKKMSRLRLQNALIGDPLQQRMASATTVEEWQAAHHESCSKTGHAPLPTELQLYCRMLDEQADNYMRLMASSDMHGLMFHLRSELMRSSAGGSGYARDGNVEFRKHRFALNLIGRSQAKVVRALRYIATGMPPPPSMPGSMPGSTPNSPARAPAASSTRATLPRRGSFSMPTAAERLAFINETRSAFGRTALLLSGGAAFGFKHAGVLRALHRHKLLPRIISGTSAGSIAAAAVCVCNDDECTQRLETGLLNHVVEVNFFGVQRGASAADLQHLASCSSVEALAAASGGGEASFAARGLRRARDITGGVSTKRLQRAIQATKGSHVLDQGVLRRSILPLLGHTTFLESYDRSGRVLNICVTRSDGKAAPLMCNYLTTPQMLIYSACLASCAIPGVYQPVELLAKERDGSVVPFFKHGAMAGMVWTDGGLQADLPKARLAELFNVNQFIVSQVNPLAPLFIPVETGVPLLTESLKFLHKQLVGFVAGASELGRGRFVRPFGFRLVDLLMQDYEGSVTLFPEWQLQELGQFIQNFDETRMEQYELDGARAVWPHLPLIRSLCEIEFALDTISTELSQQIAHERSVGSASAANLRSAGAGAASGAGAGAAGDDDSGEEAGELDGVLRAGVGGGGGFELSAGLGAPQPRAVSGPGRIPAVSSQASLLSLGVDWSRPLPPAGTHPSEGSIEALEPTPSTHWTARHTT